MRNSGRKRGALLLARHASPYVPTVDVRVGLVKVLRGQNGDTDTELKDEMSFGSLSPAVWVSPAVISHSREGEGQKAASPQVQIVQDSAAAGAADLAFWDGATVTPVSVEQRSRLGDASR